MRRPSRFRFLYRLPFFGSDRRGVAAVEFALILPFLLVLMIGIAETTTGLNYKRKISQIASSLADLVAQTEKVNSSEMSDIIKATEAIMEPYSTSGLQVIVASIAFDKDGNPQVVWSVDENKGTPWAKGSVPPIAIPDALKLANTYLVVGFSSYTYVPTFASMLQNIFPRAASIDLEDTYFLRPRLSESVSYN
ncbi:TadE/TadG family type IV pilus assembly protein [Polymorphum gilvum]|uniref:TadE/TadG family type IV pilus assembly protein n=1 Tax=Polymorphum gilvum TaxID=991904 RepID=UPI000A0299A1